MTKLRKIEVNKIYLLKSMGYSTFEIARKLDIQPSLVSYYLKQKRRYKAKRYIYTTKRFGEVGERLK